MSDHGDNTRDLRHRLHPGGADRAERNTRRFGFICLTAGIVLPLITFAVGLAFAAATDNDAFQDEAARLFAVLAMIAMIGLGCMLVVIGGVERIIRGMRDGIDRNRILVERLTVDVRERYDLLVGLVAPVAGRIAGLEDAHRVLIEVLPQEIQRQYWTGYNTAVREGFKATGTDGDAKRQGRHIGLVPPDDTPDD